MSCWLCVVDESNWNVVTVENVWGVKEKDRKKLDRTQVGDFLVFYIKDSKQDDIRKDSVISGIFKINSKPYTDPHPLFAFSNELKDKFVYRVKIEPVIVPPKPLDFRSIVSKLRFPKNKKKWFLSLQVAMRELPYNDFAFIMSSLKKNAALI
jgi:predicted RNA-binding protein